MRVAWWMLCAVACACTSEPPSAFPPAELPAGTSTQTITILGYRFEPEHLLVTPGSTVLVINEDTVDHWVTSEAVPGSYQYGEVGGVKFDLRIPAAIGLQFGLQSFSIPADAQPGTVIPYFCRMLGTAMVNQPDITIAAP